MEDGLDGRMGNVVVDDDEEVDDSDPNWLMNFL